MVVKASINHLVGEGKGGVGSREGREGRSGGVGDFCTKRPRGPIIIIMFGLT